MIKKKKMPPDYLQDTIGFREFVFRRMEERNVDRLWLRASTREVKKIVVIAAASRSGSSLLFSILRNMPGMYSLSGESVPFYKLNGLSGDAWVSDQIPDGIRPQRWNLSGLSRDLFSDLSFAPVENEKIQDHAVLEDYIDELALRFSLQWPTVNFSYDLFRRLAYRAYESYIKCNNLFSVEGFYLELLFSLRSRYSKINPYYYDISCDRIKKKFPFLEMPSGPANNFLTIEEPPFVLLPLRRRPRREELANKTLLLKSSADCYRLSFLGKVFPKAQIRIIYLTRNPFGSINGLYDGWLHRGFFSHNLKGILKKHHKTLGISGYSDCYKWGRWWWKYDLPLGWQNYTHKKLEEVCAFQWYSANEAVQRYLNKSKKEHCLVRYESIVDGLVSRVTEIKKIINFIGLNVRLIKTLNLEKLSIVQATEPPKIYRWEKRKSMLMRFLSDPKISKMSAGLGYRKNNLKEWL
jgi:hypothetical protein